MSWTVVPTRFASSPFGPEGQSGAGENSCIESEMVHVVQINGITLSSGNNRNFPLQSQSLILRPTSHSTLHVALKSPSHVPGWAFFSIDTVSCDADMELLAIGTCQQTGVLVALQ